MVPKQSPEKEKQKEKDALSYDISLPYHKRKRVLGFSLKEGVSASVKVGFTQSFMVPFAIALNAPLAIIAAFATLPELVGSFFQLFTINALNIIRKKKRLLLLSALFEAVLWLPILLIPFVSSKYHILILAFVCMESLFAKFKLPIWNSLIGEVVQENERGKFFGRRNRAIAVITFASTIVAGIILSLFSKLHPFLGFGILFFVAFLARMLCLIYHTTLPEVLAKKEQFKPASIIEFVKNRKKTDYGLFVNYMSLLEFSVMIASPFFMVYLLRDLKFSYFSYAMLMAAAMLSSFFFTNMWGRRIDKEGAKAVLTITGYLAPIIPLLWLFSSDFYYLFAVQFFSGIVWSGLNLSSSTFVFDSIVPSKRVKYFSYYNFFIGLFVFLGTMFGSFLAKVVPSFGFISTLPVLFIISAILRFFVTLRYLPRVREARLVSIPLSETAVKSSVLMRPGSGIIYYATSQALSGQKPGQKTTADKVSHAKKSIFTGKDKEIYKKRVLRLLKKSVRSDSRFKGSGEFPLNEKDIGKILQRLKMEKWKKK